MKILWLFVFFILSSQQVNGRLYFFHIPKTAGTSLRLMLESQVSAADIYPYRSQTVRAAPITHELVSGHFSYRFCKRKDQNFEAAFKVTILRDPVERYLSFLRAQKRGNSEFLDLESVMARRHHPSKKYSQGLIDNALCRNLAAEPSLEGEALLESAKQTLQELDCVLLFENFTQEVMELFGRLGVSLNEKDVPRLNTTAKEPVNERLLVEIRQVNQLDIELYKYAKNHLQKKTTEYQLRTHFFDELLKKSSRIDYQFDLPLNGRGWSYREEDVKSQPIYRWVMNEPAYIYFSLEEGSDYDLYFAAKPLSNKIFPRVSINGKEIEIHKLNNEQFSLYYGKIPRDCITDTPTEVSFYSPVSLQYKDNRNNRHQPSLSFAVNRIEIQK